MDAGRLTVTGQTEAAANVKLEWKQEEETLDAFGNIVKIKQQKKNLNNKEKKKVRPAVLSPWPLLHAFGSPATSWPPGLNMIFLQHS